MYLAHSFMRDEKKQNSQPPLILAVEDHDDSRLLIGYALELLGCRFICQSDSSTTLLVAKEHQPHVIMLDILLPGLSGTDIVHYLKQEPLTSHIPVIAVTALSGKEDKERLLSAGFDGYINKPYMIEDLEAIIHRMLSGQVNSAPMMNSADTR
jgi:CheY-like chemotaxis protein